MPLLIPSPPKDEVPFRMLEHFRVRLLNVLRGAVVMRTKTVAINTTLDASASFWIVDTTGASVTLTLPPVQDYTNETYVVKKPSAANTLTITAPSALIDGSASVALTAARSVARLTSDGTTWWTW